MAVQSLLTYANGITITDKMGIIYDLIAAAFQDGTPDYANDLAVDIMGTVVGNQDVLAYYVLKDLMDSANTLQENMTTAHVAQVLMQNFLSVLNQHCLQRGPQVNSAISSLDSYASYENAIAFNRFLFSPAFRDAYYALAGQNLSAANCYAPALAQGGTYTNGLGKWDYDGGGFTFTNGAAVDTTKYMGGIGKLKVTTPIEYTVDKTLTITVSGKGYDDTNVEITTTWTKTSTGGTLANGDYDLVGNDTKYLRDVTNIVLAVSDGGAVTAGVCYVEVATHRTPA